MPIKIFLSRQDHVVPPSNGLLIANSVSSENVEITYFSRSYHVVALDYEAEELINESNAFIGRVLEQISENSLNV